MLAPFLTAEKQAIVFGPRDCGEIVRGKLGCVLPVHHESDPGVLLRLEAQRVRRPAPLAQPHRDVGGVGTLGHGEACAAAPLRRVHENSATTMRHMLTIAVASTGAGGRRLEDNPSIGMQADAGRARATEGYVGRID